MNGSSTRIIYLLGDYVLKVTDMAFDNIHNYFEKLVFEVIQTKLHKDGLDNDEDFLGDIACVALNQLPSRYVRHDVDLDFYMSSDEREQNIQLTEDAVTMAIDYVKKHHHNQDPATTNQ